MRAERDWTQNEVVRRAKVGRNAYINAEHGLEIHASTAGKIAKGFRVPLEELEERSA